MTVRTRFAPSPTGYLHIGGARTALFNYLFARRHGGQFVLRVDDTDEARNIAEAVKPILDGLQWLGLSWDDGPHYQSGKKAHYRDLALKLIEGGEAYVDGGEPPAPSKKPYRGRNRNLDPHVQLNLAAEPGWAIRYKVPDGEDVVVNDLVRGTVAWKTNQLGDPVIIRANGTATYNFATAADDAELKITHVIRGEEHLSNTPLQMLLIHALGYVPPLYAHLPFVCEPNSRKKLSKRNTAQFATPEVRAQLRRLGYTDDAVEGRLNPVTLGFYRALGYKPAGVANYLARLGWSLDGTTEVMDMATMARNFSLDRVTSAAAQFDPKKMVWVNGEHVATDTEDAKALHCMDYLIEAGAFPRADAAKHLDRVREAVRLGGSRIKLYSDILTYGLFLWRQPPEFDKADFEKYVSPGVAVLFDQLGQTLQALPEWTAEAVEACVRAFATVRGIKPNVLIFAIRVAICGQNVGPPLYESVAMLGQKETVNRMWRAMTKSVYLLGGS